MRSIERSNAWRVNRSTAQLQRSKGTFPSAKKSWLLAALNFRVFLKPLRRLAMNLNGESTHFGVTTGRKRTHQWLWW